jgi:hypothetical protein
MRPIPRRRATMNSRKHSYHPCLLIAAFSLNRVPSSGCLWGFVRDAETGDPAGIDITT